MARTEPSRIKLTDKAVRSAKMLPEKGRDRVYHYDTIVPGLALCVTERQNRSFVLGARYPVRPTSFVSRLLGTYPSMSVEQARVKARRWLELIERGVDPSVEAAREKAEQQRLQGNTFAALAEAYLERHVKGPAFCRLEQLAVESMTAEPGLKKRLAFRQVCSDPKNAELVQRSRREGIQKKGEAERIIHQEFIPRWGSRPACEVTQQEVASAIMAIVKRDARYQAYNAFGYLRGMYRWGIATGEFGLAASPLVSLRPAALAGNREVRQRILSDAELRAIWQAVDGSSDVSALAEARRRDQSRPRELPIGYPYGPLFKLLILTGQREREVADMRWDEIDFDRRLWTIPASRMKNDRAHEVPLTQEALTLLKSLPRFPTGNCVFTTTSGAKPVNGFSKVKERLDKIAGLSGWKIHDLRRTMRTHLSALPVQDLVRELVIAHSRPGLHRVYDLHAYQDEKRECLELWGQRLRDILGLGYTSAGRQNYPP